MFIRDADEPLLHGGDLAAARHLFPDAPEPFLDLSTGINPNSYPLPDLSADLFARLPQAEALAALAAAAANAYGAPSAAHVVCAPGTQILLPLVASLVGSGRAAVVSPNSPILIPRPTPTLRL
jgi:cobalamin biosynthetic protein CobC